MNIEPPRKLNVVVIEPLPIQLIKHPPGNLGAITLREPLEILSHKS
ncbi:MAG: hypothetical protein JWL65_2198 [Gammaproteobacteria bacterium]|nr:hypothetical protein [Gammaproteobacteria bacterium]